MGLRLDKRLAETHPNWDTRDAPLMVEDGGRREKPGVRASVRMSKHKLVYCLVDPRQFRSDERPPPEVQSALENVMGERAKDLLLALHPVFHRWCLYQRVHFPERGENLWQVVSVFCEEVVEGQIPSDFIGDPVLEALAEGIGEFRVPDQRDFELIEPTDRKKYTEEQRLDYLTKYDQDEEKRLEQQFEEFKQDFADYYNWAFTNYANQLYGSGERMQSVPTIVPKTNPERWTIEQRNGYQVRLKKGSRLDNELREQREAEDKIAEEIEARRADPTLGFSKKLTAEQILQFARDARAAKAEPQKSYEKSGEAAPVFEPAKVAE